MPETSMDENVQVEKLSLSHRKVYTDIIIDASPEQVWSVLADTSSYKNWAAFLVDIQGEIKQDQRVTIAFQLNPKKDKLTTIDHTLSVVEGKEFYWAEKGPGGVRDSHHFQVELTSDGKTRFVQSDEIMGGISWLLGGYLAKMYAAGYCEFNRSLKAEAERRQRG